MTRPLALLALAAALAVAPEAPAQTPAPDVYVVRPGDTLFRISRAHGLSVERLRELNGLDGDYISVGQSLRLTDRAPAPAGARPEAPPARPEAPPARPGDAGGPARPVPVRTVPDGPPPDAGDREVHVVEPGETLFRIALRYDTSVEALRRLNGVQGDRIEVGQRLVVRGTPVGPPGSAGPAGPVALGPVALGPPRDWSITGTVVPADLVHFVEPGETLYSIAAALDLDAGELARANALSTAPLRPGTMLRLPEPRDPALALRAEMAPADEAGLALVYPDAMTDRPTASGEPYDPASFTMSHREHPFGTVLLVTNPATGRSTFARVVDRGPVSRAYLVELSAAAAAALELDPNAARRVEVRRLP